jgi:Zn finger protein HypA/HybF involved in hydrogenase expression
MAAALWTTVPQAARDRILTNVFCSQCLCAVEMRNYHGKEHKGDLILTGACSKCGHKVVRVIETSELRIENN